MNNDLPVGSEDSGRSRRAYSELPLVQQRREWSRISRCMRNVTDLAQSLLLTTPMAMLPRTRCKVQEEKKHCKLSRPWRGTACTPTPRSCPAYIGTRGDRGPCAAERSQFNPVHNYSNTCVLPLRGRPLQKIAVSVMIAAQRWR